MLMIIVLSFLFLMSVQPIMMVIMLISITLFYSLFVFKIMSSYWFGYALMLVMLSGVLVVFTYMASLLPNESFEVLNLSFIVLFIFLYVKFINLNYSIDLSFLSMNLWFSFIGMFNLFLISFLLSMMIMVVWLSCVEKGAIRVF